MSPPLDTVGPLTRTVRDNSLMLNVIAGHDPKDSGSVARRHPMRCDVDLERGVGGLRIGFVRHFHEADLQAHPEVAAALENVAEALRSEGAIISEVRLPPLKEMAAATLAILYSHAWARHARWLRERPADYGAISRTRLMAGAFLSAGDLIRADAFRRHCIDAVQAVFRDADILLCGNMMDPLCKMEQPKELVRTFSRQARMPFSLTGHPALGMMAGLDSNGLPLGVQFVGRYFDEATVLRAARCWERIAGTDQMHPPLGLEPANQGLHG